MPKEVYTNVNDFCLWVLQNFNVPNMLDEKIGMMKTLDLELLKHGVGALIALVALFAITVVYFYGKDD